MNRYVKGAVSWRWVCGIFLLALCIVSLGVYRDYRNFVDAPLIIEQDRSFDVELGASFRQIVDHLRTEHLTEASPLYWRALAAEFHVSNNLHAGEYALNVGITPRELLQHMIAGEVIQHKFTIVEGWTFHQSRLALANEKGIKATLPGLSDEEIGKRLGITDGQPEGWFLPETYTYVKGSPDFEILKRAHAAMQELLDTSWALRAPDLPLQSPMQALILASIVEKETGRADERPLIAGLFMRRLKIGMRLQTDPTVIYGLGEAFDGNLRRRDLDTDGPFNTYTRSGLPPTPIALPGRAAIEAVLHPAPGDALYFVARGDGSHEFSATLEAHNRAVAHYQLHHSR